MAAAMQEGRRRRIAELALEGKKIRTGRRRPKPELSPEAQQLVGLIRQVGENRRIREEAESAEQQTLPRKRGRPTNAEVLARFGVKSDEELIAKARAALLVQRQRLLGSV
ncbi:MAG TPA: hypothetical protein VKB42_11125 [Dongiaceae bacterium]|nr:hypothetical protein [Dongiaceae bacterium]